MKIFLTGDRSLHPVVAVNAVYEVLTHLDQFVPEGTEDGTVDIVTSNAPHGVDAAVRFLLGAIGSEALVVDAGHTDDDLRLAHETAKADGAEVAIVLHGDPLTSHVARSALAVWGDAAHLLGGEV
jgi:hypothetical protein